VLGDQIFLKIEISCRAVQDITTRVTAGHSSEQREETEHSRLSRHSPAGNNQLSFANEKTMLKVGKRMGSLPVKLLTLSDTCFDEGDNLQEATQQATERAIEQASDTASSTISDAASDTINDVISDASNHLQSNAFVRLHLVPALCFGFELAQQHLPVFLNELAGFRVLV
jgi:hypothetical protein